MDTTINDRLDKMIELLTSLTQTLAAEPKKTPPTPLAAASLQKKSGSEATTDAAKPRQVIEEDVGVKIDAYGDDAKKFWKDLFGKYFEKEKETDKPKESGGGFWKTLLTLLGGILLGIVTFFEKEIWPYIKKAYKFFVDAFELVKGIFSKVIQGFKDMYALLKEGKIGEIFERIITKIKGFFRGIKLKIFKTLRKSKLGRAILKVYRSITKAFGSIFKAVGKVLGKIRTGKVGGALSKVFRMVGRIFKVFIKVVKTVLGTGGKILGTVGRAVGRLFKAFGSIGKIIARLLPGIKIVGRVVGKLFLPLTILMSAFDIFDGLFTTIKNEGLSFTSVLKGFAVGLIKIFTLGFFDSDQILGGLNAAIDKLSGWFKDLWEFITDIPGKAKNLLKKIPGIGAFFSESGQAPEEKTLKQKQEVIKVKPETTTPANMPFGTGFQTPEGKPVETPAQDFISRPGKPAFEFSSKDTIIGMKEGGPFDVFTKETLNIQKKSLVKDDQMIEAFKTAIQILNDISVSLKQNRADNQQQTTIISAPKMNNITLGQTNPTSLFRGQLA